MRVLDLFSGIGGFSLGLERAGMRTVAFCEIDPFCREVLRKHWPNIPCSEDITTREFKEGEADVICGGFPCQDISLAGAGAGLAGSRSGLWRDLLRAIRLVRPNYAIVENVAALLGRGMGTVLGDLAEVGYDAEWHCIPASSVGAPHRRDRIWIVAYPGGIEHEGRGDAFRRALAAELPRALARNVAHAAGDGRRQGRPHARGSEARVSTREELGSWHGGEALAHAGCVSAQVPPPGGQPTIQEFDGAGWWATEPDVGRVAHGVPARVDRLRSLGNAVVPQIPEIIGRAIMKLCQDRKSE